MAEPGQYTVGNLPASLAQRLKALAEVEGISVSAPVLRLLEKVVGVGERRRRLEERYGTGSDCRSWAAPPPPRSSTMSP